MTFVFLNNFKATASPLNLQSRQWPRYSTVLCCFIKCPPLNIYIYIYNLYIYIYMYIYAYNICIYICIFIYMIISFKPIASEDRIGLGLSSPKWTKSLLSINHFHIDENCLFKICSIILTLSLGRKYNYHLHTNRSQPLIVIGKFFLHIIENRVLQK